MIHIYRKIISRTIYTAMLPPKCILKRSTLHLERRKRGTIMQAAIAFPKSRNGPDGDLFRGQ